MRQQPEYRRSEDERLDILFTLINEYFYVEGYMEESMTTQEVLDSMKDMYPVDILDVFEILWEVEVPISFVGDRLCWAMKPKKKGYKIEEAAQ